MVVHRTLEITLMGAKDLKQVNLVSCMHVYGVVSISGGPANPQQIKSPVDIQGHRNPNWNVPMKFTIDAAAAEQNRLTLNFKLRSQRSLGDRDIGEVRVPLKELLSGDGKSDQFVSYPVCRPSGRAKGELNFSYKIGAVAKSDEPVTGYPAGHPSAGYPAGLPAAYAATYSGGSYAPPPGYPPQPGSHQPAGYPAAYAATDSGGSYAPPPGYPPQPGYHQPAGHPAAYAATNSGGTYGYPPPVQKPKKNKMTLGLGAGLLGRWVIGNMILDDGPDDGGFDGGFDF